MPYCTTTAAKTKLNIKNYNYETYHFKFRIAQRRDGCI